MAACGMRLQDFVLEVVPAVHQALPEPPEGRQEAVARQFGAEDRKVGQRALAGDELGEAPPGLRESSIGPLYLAYVRDPDGNKLCAIYRVK